MRFVPIKEQAQLDLQTIHRVRQRLVGRRTALINQLRAILLERGIIIPQRRRVLDRQLPGLLADDGNGLSPRIRLLIEDIRAEWRELDTRIKGLDDELIATAKTVDTCRRLCEIPGIGALNARALMAAVSNGAAFGKGRDMAAWLGLTPREHSTGGKQRLLGISKQGNTYLRTLLIHGARGLALLGGTARRPWRVVAQAARPSAPQRRHRRSCQQAGPHRLGGAQRNPAISITRSGVNGKHGVSRDDLALIIPTSASVTSAMDKRSSRRLGNLIQKNGRDRPRSL